MYYKNLKKITSLENGKIFITLKGNCVLSGKEFQVKLEEQYYQLLEKGTSIMPLIGPEKMEFLISGISPKSWGNILRDEE